ncbi:MAG: hypothetical protein QM750_19010 [Rubrivivax sp.]
MTPVIWFDDEWNTEREDGLAPWQRALQAEQSAGRLRLTMCNRVVEFARLLRDSTAGEGAERRRFELLIIDVMLTNEPERTYASLGFDEERVIKLDAGAQLAALIRSTLFDAERPEWLRAYVGVPMMLLSSSPNLRSLVSDKVGYKRMGSLKMVPKSLVTRAGHEGVDADEEFIETVRELLDRDG